MDANQKSVSGGPLQTVSVRSNNSETGRQFTICAAGTWRYTHYLSIRENESECVM